MSNRLLLLPLALALAAAQTPEFDAASVKCTVPPGDGRYSIGSRFETGRFIAEYVNMHDLIQEAYAVPAGHKIVGPDWLDTVPGCYNITAKAAGPATTKELRVMLQSLLASRFQLKLHIEDRQMPIYFLTAGAKGIKLTPVTFDGDSPNSRAIHYLRNGVEFKHTSMGLLANFLTWLGRPAIDQTGSKDLYDFTLTYATKGGMPLLDVPADSDQPSILTALQEIGLKLESRQGPVSTYVVDHVEKSPAEN